MPATQTPQPVKKTESKQSTAKRLLAKSKGASTKPARKKAERDSFGFRKNTKTSIAAALYARPEGATQREIRDACGGKTQLNLLRVVEKRGFKVIPKKEKFEDREITRYFIMTEKKAAAERAK